MYSSPGNGRWSAARTSQSRRFEPSLNGSGVQKTSHLLIAVTHGRYGDQPRVPATRRTPSVRLRNSRRRRPCGDERPSERGQLGFGDEGDTLVGWRRLIGQTTGGRVHVLEHVDDGSGNGGSKPLVVKDRIDQALVHPTLEDISDRVGGLFPVQIVRRCRRTRGGPLQSRGGRQRGDVVSWRTFRDVTDRVAGLLRSPAAHPGRERDRGSEPHRKWHLRVSSERMTRSMDRG